jgi:predicted RNA methylase
MGFHKLTVRSFAVLVLFTSLGVAQTSQPKHNLDVPYVPTTEEAVKAMLTLAEVKKTDIVYDLGCGDGRIVIAAAKEYGAHGVGIDINRERIQEAAGNAKKAGVEKLVRFEEKDLFKADIHEATGRYSFPARKCQPETSPQTAQEFKTGHADCIEYVWYG